MTLARSRRWRRALVATCLPYVLLWLFADFIHLHPLVSGSVSQDPVSQHVAAPEARDAGFPDSTCVVCQWMRAGAGLQPSVAASPTVVVFADGVTSAPETCPTRPALLSPDFRGPPLPQFA